VGLTFAIEGVCALAGILMVLRARRRGVFVNGYRAGPARPLALGLAALFVLADAAGAWLKAEAGLSWAPILAGLLLAPFAVLLSRAAQDAYRRELKAAL
jgi:hypothetical protein